MWRLLLVDDSTHSQQLVKKALGPGFEIACAKSKAEASDAMMTTHFDLILLDVVLPDGDGFEFLAGLRQKEPRDETPVIFLTGKTSVTDKVLGLTLGAEDYVTKPFEPLELKARVETKLQRGLGTAQSPFVRKGALEIDMALHRAALKEKSGTLILDLTPTEFKLLSFLARNENRVVSREQILTAVWGHQEEVFDRAIDKHIWALRQKLKSAANYIQTVPTVGYLFSSKE